MGDSRSRSERRWVAGAGRDEQIVVIVHDLDVAVGSIIEFSEEGLRKAARN